MEKRHSLALTGVGNQGLPARSESYTNSRLNEH